MIRIELQIVKCMAHGLQHLIGRHNAFKTVQRDRVGDPRIMRVKGDDVRNAH